MRHTRMAHGLPNPCKFTVFALFYFVFEGNSKYKPVGGLYLKGQLNGGFFALPFGGLIFGGAYFWNFTV